MRYHSVCAATMALVWALTLTLAHVYALGWLWRLLRLANPARLQFCFHGPRHAPPPRSPVPPGDGISDVFDVHPLMLEWDNLGCAYTTPAGPTIVLQGVWGAARPRKLHALLGPSGAGKSHVLDLLGQRKQVGRLTGHVLVNGCPATAATIVRASAYVPQDDNFMAVLTALETLCFYADMCASTANGLASPTARHARVQAVMCALGLAHCAATLVGGCLPGGVTLRGLSGGERKRLALAVGLLGAPSLLLLDEPTTGLDSYAALQTMRHIRAIAEAGRTVLASIHQPRAAIWALFDDVTVLCQGRLLYTGECASLVQWFTTGLPRALADAHDQQPCPPALPTDSLVVKIQPSVAPGSSTDVSCAPGVHPSFAYDPSIHGVASDWVLDLLSEAAGLAKQDPEHYGAAESSAEGDGTQGAALSCNMGEARAGRVPVHAWSAAFFRTQRPGASGQGAEERKARAALPRVRITIACSSRGAASTAASGSAIHAAGHWRDALARLRRQLRATLERELRCTLRNPADVAGRMLTFAWVAVLAGLVFFAIPPGALLLRLNLHFSNTAFFLLMPYVSVSLYTADRRLFLADSAAQLYPTAVYYIAKVVATTPFHVLAAVVFSLIVQDMTDLGRGAAWIAQAATLSTLVSLIAIQVLHMAAALAPNQDIAFMLSIAWTAVNLLMSGFFIPYNQFAFQWLTALRWVSAQGYAFEGLAHMELAGQELSCSQGLGAAAHVLQALPELLPNTLLPQSSAALLNALQAPDSKCTINVDAMRKVYGLRRGFSATLGILLGYLGVMHLMTFAALQLASRRERR